jgi:hypothetical protein
MRGIKPTTLSFVGSDHLEATLLPKRDHFLKVTYEFVATERSAGSPV